MEAKKEMAVERFMKGYNCCQAVACAYCEELGMREEDVFKMTEGFGSGMGGLKDTCGAVTGSLPSALRTVREIWRIRNLPRQIPTGSSGRQLQNSGTRWVPSIAGIC